MPVPAPDPQDSSTHHDTVEITSEIGNLGFSHNGGQSGNDFVLNLWSYDPDDDILTFDVTGTHDDETTPASWFNQQTTGHVVHTDVYVDDEPQELHYAWCGTLTFDTFNNAGTSTCFGQGESGLENNWWMGGAGYDDQREGCFIDPTATDTTATSLVACMSTPGTSSYKFELNDGGAKPNYLSLYSPDQSASFDPQTVGQNVESYILAHDSGLSASDKAALRALVAALPDETYTTPTLWSLECTDACTGDDDHSVTSGQLFAGVHDTTQYDGVVWKEALEGKNVNNYSINATAGRNKSDAVADWFTNAVGPGGGMIGAGASATTTAPNQLHFAFCGDLISAGGTGSASVPTCFGQGENSDDGEANNWWAGGPDWHLMDSTDPDMLAAFAPVEDLGPLGDTEARILLNPRYGTALVALTGNIATGVAVDGAMFVVGIG